MNRTNSPLDEAYATCSGLDLTLKDQSVLESHVQASSTPRRLNYIPSKTLHEQNDYYCSEQFNAENNSFIISEHINQVQNSNESLENNKQLDQRLGFNYSSGSFNSKGSTVSCYHSVQSNNLDYSKETANPDKLSPLDLRIKSFSDDINLINNRDSGYLVITTDTKTECEISTHIFLSNQAIPQTKRSNIEKQTGSSFNIQSILGVTDQFKVFSETTSNTDSNTNDDNIKNNNIEIIDRTKTSNSFFDQFLVGYLQVMNPLLLSSRGIQMQSVITPPQPVDTTVTIQSTNSVSTTLPLNETGTVKFSVKQRAKKLNPTTSMYSITNGMTNRQLDVKNNDPIHGSLKQTERIQQSMKNVYDLSGSSLSSEDDVITRQRAKTSDVGKTPVILYCPEPSDSKTKVKAMLERNDPCLKYVNDGAAIRNPFAIDRKIQLVHLTSLLFERLVLPNPGILYNCLETKEYQLMLKMMLIGYNLCILLNFSSKSGVKLDNGTYLCKGCNRTTKRLRPMQQHLLSHSASKFNLCVKCLKGFNDKYDMKRHTRKHTLVRPYVCPECGRSFSQRCSLEGHRRKIHRIQLNYPPNQRREIVRVCETCGYSCPELYDMLQHTLNNHPYSNCLPRLQRQLIRYKEKLQSTSLTSDDDNRSSNIRDTLEATRNWSCISPFSNNHNFT
ncbi:ovo-like 2 [Schistosoma haematobium]|uniref:Ovo-like 2 n=1 Tax=Schistosoma haematobium TaxID=6185 RepID=A0A095AWA9_SCHHA|nr:ovo-like 2 [Schistosoma haematobium]KAH9591011.1 ovo-like 2 [Schistosoma haematobium]